MAFSYRSNPETKDHTRINDIVKIKAPGDIKKQKALALQQANVITDPYKTLRRARACVDVKEYDLAKIFLQRVIDLDQEGILEACDLAVIHDLNFAFEMGLFF